MNCTMKWIAWAFVVTAMLAAGCAGLREQKRLAERERLKEEILEEIRAEFWRSNAVPSLLQPPVSSSAKSPASSTAVTPTPPPARPASVGSAKGQLLEGNQGIPFIKVRLVRMEAFHSLRSADYRDNDYYDTKTDADGRFWFSFIEPGRYKLLWAPPHAEYWVRRLADKPDVVVEPGEVAVMRTLETKGRLVGD